MTNKIFSLALLLGAALLFTDCKREEDDLFSKSAAERLNDVKDVYSKRLTANEAGWALQYYPQIDEEAYSVAQRGYLMLAKFRADQTVDMAMNYWPEDQGDDKVAYRTTMLTDNNSLWEVISDNGPVLTFNSYNKVIHHFSNPEMYGSNDGYKGDYEFVIIDAPEDGSHILLKGKKRGTYNMMTPLPAGTDFQTYLDDVLAFQNKMFPAGLPYEPLIQIGGQNYAFRDAVTRFPVIYPEGKDPVVDGKHMPFVVTKQGDRYYLRFRDAVSFDDGANKAQNFYYDPAADEFIDAENAENKIVAGVEPNGLFDASLKKGYRFVSYRSPSMGRMSDKMRQAFEAASDAMTSVSKSYRIDSLFMTKTNEENKLVWSFKYQTNGRVMNYLYDYTVQDNAITLTFDKPDGTVPSNIYNHAKTGDLRTLLKDVFGQKFLVDKDETLFNMTRLKLTAESDKDLWFVVYIKN